MHVAFTGGISIVYLIVFVAIASIPIWFGAQVTGAAHPTLLRSMLSLVTGVIGSFIGMFFGFPLALLIAPLAFMCSFKFILDMSFSGAIMLCIIAVLGGALMIKFAASRVSKDQETETSFIVPHQGLAYKQVVLLTYREDQKSLSTAKA